VDTHPTRERIMATPVFVTFRHMQPRPELEEYARAQVGRLERFYGRIVDCRVQLEPNDGALRVVVEISVPGERLVATYESEPETSVPPDAERPAAPEHRWLHAIHEAFEAAGHVLQTYASRRLTRSRQIRGRAAVGPLRALAATGTPSRRTRGGSR
jgi:hypothetical protein